MTRHSLSQAVNKVKSTVRIGKSNSVYVFSTNKGAENKCGQKKLLKNVSFCYQFQLILAINSFYSQLTNIQIFN